MRNTIRITGLSLAIMVGAANQMMAAGTHAHGHAMGPGPSFEALDANGDGQVSRDEIAAHQQARFAETDTNGDGKLSREEITARAAAKQAERRTRFIDKMFEKRDANGDGALAPEEMQNDRADRMFAKADTDGNGLVSEAEFEQMRTEHRRWHGIKADDEARD